MSTAISEKREVPLFTISHKLLMFVRKTLFQFKRWQGIACGITGRRAMAPLQTRQLCKRSSDPPNLGRSYTAGSAVTVAGIAVSALMLGLYVQRREEAMDSAVEKLVLWRCLTEDEQAQMRQVNQAYLSKRKQSMTLGVGIRIQYADATQGSEELQHRARLRYETLPAGMRSTQEKGARQDLQQWIQCKTPVTPAEIQHDLQLWYAMLYDEEELGMIAQSPRCRAAIAASEFPTSEEVRLWSR
jgi:hypothetical protein